MMPRILMDFFGFFFLYLEMSKSKPAYKRECADAVTVYKIDLYDLYNIMLDFNCF